ncbi:MAG: hypothetical protein LBR26_01245 [Prevotella sp.]|jgi:hypothetical protein|nr:hypothetical protein [Prevotella sp.]
MRKNNITYSMHKTISATGSVHRKAFARFFGQGAFSCSFGLAFRTSVLFGLALCIDRLQVAIWKAASLSGLCSEFRQLNIKRRKSVTDHSVGFNTFVG